jgi:hypothetical protein
MLKSNQTKIRETIALLLMTAVFANCNRPENPSSSSSQSAPTTAAAAQAKVASKAGVASPDTTGLDIDENAPSTLIQDPPIAGTVDDVVNAGDSSRLSRGKAAALYGLGAASFLAGAAANLEVAAQSVAKYSMSAAQYLSDIGTLRKYREALEQEQNYLQYTDEAMKTKGSRVNLFELEEA